MSAAIRYLKRGLELAAKGQLEDALHEVKAALAEEPGNERGLLYRFSLEARIHAQAGRIEDAKRCYHAVLALDTHNAEARSMLKKYGDESPPRSPVSPPSEPPETANPASTLFSGQPTGRSLSDMPTPTPPSPQSEPPGEERRRSTRVAVELEVEIGLHSETNFYTGYTGDLSEGGLFVATYNLLPIGTRIQVAFGLGGHEIKTEAEVRWVRDPHDMSAAPGIGVRFTELASADEAIIHRFMAARAPLFHDDD